MRHFDGYLLCLQGQGEREKGQEGKGIETTHELKNESSVCGFHFGPVFLCLWPPETSLVKCFHRHSRIGKSYTAESKDSGKDEHKGLHVGGKN